MLDSLKDLYISYPFMPVENPPDFYKHVKDIRCVVTVPALNPISLVENDNYIRAFLLRLDGNTARVRVICSQFGDVSGWTVIDIPVFTTEQGAPGTQSYIVVDEQITVNSGSYELQPDTLLFIQKAPYVYISALGEPDENGYKQSGPVIDTENGNNVSITKGQNGIIIYGAPGAGLGLYASVPGCYPVPEHLQNKGAISINGLYGDVWLKEAHPVAIDYSGLITSNGVYKLQIKNGEV